MLKPTMIFLALAGAIGAVTCARAGNTGPGTDTCQGSTCVEATPNGSSVVNVYADPSAASSAAARSSATGGAGGSATAMGGGAVVNVANHGGGAAGSRGVRELRTVGVAPDIVANPTAPCRVALGAGGGWLGGALSLSGSVLDEGCDARADVMLLLSMNQPAAAIARACQKPELAQALGCVAVREADKPISPVWQH